MMSRLFELINIAYRSRLLFPDEESYRKCLGVSYDTVVANRDDADAIGNYYKRLDDECIRQTDFDLEFIIRAYLGASAAHASEDLDWGKRLQLASRKNFCRRLFRFGYAQEVEFANLFPDREDRRLVRVFYPEDVWHADGPPLKRTVDVVFLLLITFGVVKPIRKDMTRSLQMSPSDTEDSLRRMTKLVSQLQADCTLTGVFDKPLGFDLALDKLQQSLASPSHESHEGVSTAWFWSVLNNLEDSLLGASSPILAAASGLRTVALDMPGIWVDNTDRGRSRCWVFPQNLCMAFLYEFTGGTRRLIPYEFCFYSHDDGSLADFCFLISPEGNRLALETTQGLIPKSEVVRLGFEAEECEDDGTVAKLTLRPDSFRIPKWLDWNSFIRLDTADELYRLWLNRLREVYSPGSFQSASLVNEGKVFTDVVNALVGLDNEYVYVSAFRKPDGFRLIHDEGDDSFRYEPIYGGSVPGRSLLSLEISHAHPLYALPRMAALPALPAESSERMRAFAEAVDATALGDQITIYESTAEGGSNEGVPLQLICFNRFSLLFPLRELPTFPGVRVIRHRDFL